MIEFVQSLRQTVGYLLESIIAINTYDKLKANDIEIYWYGHHWDKEF